VTRTNAKNHRVYIDGYDLSGYARALPTIDWGYEVAAEAALSDGINNIVLGQGFINLDALNVFLENDAAGAFAKHSANSGEVNVSFAMGTTAAPAAGDPAFAWKFKQSMYKAEAGDGFVNANIGFGGPSSEGVLTYSKPWGNILHPLGAETGANSAVGIDDVGAASTAGGVFFYHATTSDGTFTLTAEEASTNTDGNFALITGATSAEIDASAAPKHGLVALGTTAAIKRYLRFQISLNGAGTATFFCGFIRG